METALEEHPVRIPAEQISASTMDFIRKFFLNMLFRQLFATSISLLISGSNLAYGAEPATNAGFDFSAGAGFKETFDSNVNLQSYTPAVEKSSLITTVLPQIGGTWKSAPLHASLSYAPEINFFHSASTEDNVAHKISNAVGLEEGPFRLEASNTVVAIDGSDIGPTWTGPGGAPAAGGPAVRDRRDAVIDRSQAQLSYEHDGWIVRPGFTGYLHDFHTQQRSTPGYQNYVDRSQWSGGLDFGHSVGISSKTFVGYFHGWQDQGKLLQFPEEFDNEFDRVLAEFEGSLAPWLKLNFSVGPEFRRFGDRTPLSFGDRDRLNYFVDACASIKASERDNVIVSVKRFQQPGFAGRSIYDDLTVDLNWKHKLTSRVTLGCGGRAYNTDFTLSASRNDWIYSGSSFVNVEIGGGFNLEASYLYEDGESEIANTAGRNYERHAAVIGLKYRFK